MGAKIGRLPDALRVMPGLVPGIHAVRRRVDIRTSTRFSGLAAYSPGPVQRVPARMAGTSPAMTETFYFQGQTSDRRPIFAPMRFRGNDKLKRS